MNNIFYVYAYIDPRDSKIFYIGKGKKYRAKQHLYPNQLAKDTEKNRLIKDIFNDGLMPIITYLYCNLSHSESLLKEREIILEIGKDNLTNITYGGQGVLGVKAFLGKKHSAKTKEILRQARLGDKNPMFGDKWCRSDKGIQSFKEKTSGENHHSFGIPRSEEVKIKIRNKLIGLELTKEQKKDRSLKMKEVWAKRRRGELKNPNHNRKTLMEKK
jgi:hypothetical protein